MTNLKKIFAILICVTVLFTGCTGKDDGESQTPTDTVSETQAASQNVLKLPFSDNDSLNPFLAKSEINCQTASLFFQPLYKLDMNYNPVPVLASEGSVSGNSVTVTLSSAVFSDGTSVSASDVVYSFNKAKTSAAYSSLMVNFSSAKASSVGSVTFTLTSPDAFALQSLTFPIVKNGTAEKSDAVPTGSGAYILGEKNLLGRNPYNQSAKIQSVQLVDVSNAVNEAYVLQTGDISFCFDNLQSGSYTKINAVTRSVLLNNLVYLGINSASSALASQNVRVAIASAVDIDNISSSAFQGNAVATRLPFNPNWSKIKDMNYSLTSASAVSLLEKEGYNKLDKNSVRSNGTQSLKFTLVVNSDNAFKVAAANSIASTLNKIGMSVTVQALPFANYNAAIKKGAFDLYIGEIRVPDDMSLNAFFTSSGEAAAGIAQNGEAAQSYASLMGGTVTVQNFCDSFMKDMPFVPLCFRTGVSASLRGVSPSIDTDKWYSNIEDWSY